MAAEPVVEQLVFNTRLPEKEEDVAQQVLESLKDLFLNQIPGLYWAGSPGPYNVQPNVNLPSFHLFRQAMTPTSRLICGRARHS